jgi:membrane protein DedA with SNARE-associated domain
MKLIKFFLNLVMGASVLFLVFRSLIWITHRQPVEATYSLSIINQLTVVALVIMICSYAASKLFTNQPDNKNNSIQKISRTIIILLSLFVILFVLAIIWKIQTKTLFNGWEF